MSNRESKRHIPRVLAVVQAGGQGSRMEVLTSERAKPALPFAGSYQLIDFALSNLANSAIVDVWISVQYQAASLDRHLAGGRPWDLDRTRGGYRRLVPEEGGPAAMEGFSTGNADDLYRMSHDIAAADPDVVVVTSADHVFSLDLRDVIADHRERRAHCTIVTTEVPKAEAKHKAVIQIDRSRRVTAIDYKPTTATTGRIATEVFVYDAKVLLLELDRLRRHLAKVDPGLREGLGDFGEHLLPRIIKRGKTFAYPLTSYWKDLGRPEAYLAAHRDLLAGKVDVFDDPSWPMLTRFPELPPARVTAAGKVHESLLSPGCVIRGTVRNSVLGPGVVVEAGAIVEGSVLFESVLVEKGARVRCSIVDDEVVIGASARVGATPRGAIRDAAITLIGAQAHVASGARVAAGARLDPGATG